MNSSTYLRAPLLLFCVACSAAPSNVEQPSSYSPSVATDTEAQRPPTDEKPEGVAVPESLLRLGPARPFSFPELVKRAHDLAQKPFVPPAVPAPDVMERIDYDAHGKLKFKSRYALFAQGPGRYPVTFFHLGRYFRVPVRIHRLHQSGTSWMSREVEYDEAYFDMPPDSPAHELPKGSGFAGFRFQESRTADQTQKPWQQNDWVAFLGATYFRAIGDEYQYGISARAVAIDVATSQSPEEFPTFTDFFIETPSDEQAPIQVYALLDGPSITGALKFVMERRSGVVMQISESLFLREDVARLGIAPLTSMYWFSETSKVPPPRDWRPEVHDSDGLALWTGSGEFIWRPLNNAPQTIVSSFMDENPRGFGLSQRDRLFDHYLDGVHYERRPSLWVEPMGDWGRGSVQLVEIPTDDETHDNVVAMWVPGEAARRGARYDFEYRLHWAADEPFAPKLARVVATRLGQGGEPGQDRPANTQKFVVEYLGGPLETLPDKVLPEAVLWSSRGTLGLVVVEPVPDDVLGHWRVKFDLAEVAGNGPVELRLSLRQAGRSVSETWLYQWHPR